MSADLVGGRADAGDHDWTGEMTMEREIRVITKLTQTCDACPSQWEAELNDGHFAYIRYRFGVLTWRVGATIDDAVDVDRCEDGGGQRCGDGLHGVMDTEEMLRRLGDVFVLAQTE